MAVLFAQPHYTKSFLQLFVISQKGSRMIFRGNKTGQIKIMTVGSRVLIKLQTIKVIKWIK